MTATTPAPPTLRTQLAQARYNIRATRRLLESCSHVPRPIGVEPLLAATEALADVVGRLVERAEQEGER